MVLNTLPRRGWPFETNGPIFSSPAIGDVDGDKSNDIVVGSTDGKIYCLSAVGKEKWSYQKGGAIYSSPALFDWAHSTKYAKDWPMCRHNPRRTGFYSEKFYGKPAPRSGLDVCIGSNDGYIYWLQGWKGTVIDKFRAYGEIHTSPSIADVDGDGIFEIFFYDWSDVDTLWALEVQLTYPRYIRVYRTELKETQIIEFETYASGVLPNEWVAWWSDYGGEEALKAGALVIKAYGWYHILREKPKHPEYGRTTDVCDKGCCQVYDPTKTDSRTDAIKRETWHIFLMRNGKVDLFEYWDGLVITKSRVDIKESPDSNARTLKTVEKGTRLIIVNSISVNGMRQVVEDVGKVVGGKRQIWARRCSKLGACKIFNTRASPPQSESI